MSTTTQVNGIVAVVYALILAPFVFKFWPWDLLGRRRVLKLKRGRRPWE